jgi:hypothetical protein
MGDYGAITADDAVAGLTEWRLIQQMNDAADDAMLEAWIGEPITPESATRFGIDSMKGNWYFGYVFPGLASGSSRFGLDDGVGILQLQTLCLQPIPDTEESDSQHEGSPEQQVATYLEETESTWPSVPDSREDFKYFTPQPSASHSH